MPAKPKFNPDAIDTGVFGTIRKASGMARVEDVPVTEVDPQIITANPYQPRLTNNPEADAELEASIQQSLDEGGPGIHEPLVVRPMGRGYQLVAGGRRLSAALRLGMVSVPVVVRDYSDEQAQQVALIENLQRSDLRFDDEANALAELKRSTDWPATTIAKRLGKSSDYVDLRLAAVRHPDLMARYISHELNLLQLKVAITDRRQGRTSEVDSVTYGTEQSSDQATNDDSVTYGTEQMTQRKQVRVPHSGYGSFTATIQRYNQLLEVRERLSRERRQEARRHALEVLEATQRFLDEFADEE